MCFQIILLISLHIIWFLKASLKIMYVIKIYLRERINKLYLFILQIFVMHIIYLAMYLSVGSGPINDFYFILYTLLGFPNFLDHLIVFYSKIAF